MQLILILAGIWFFFFNKPDPPKNGGVTITLPNIPGVQIGSNFQPVADNPVKLGLPSLSSTAAAAASVLPPVSSPANVRGLVSSNSYALSS